MGSEFWHIVNRFAHHIFMDAGFLLVTIVGLLFLIRRRYVPPLPPMWFFFLAGAIPMVVAWLREPFDVAAGQSVIKVVTDWISHLFHWVWLYLIYRFSPTLGELSERLHDWIETRWR